MQVFQTTSAFPSRRSCDAASCIDTERDTAPGRVDSIRLLHRLEPLQARRTPRCPRCVRSARTQAEVNSEPGIDAEAGG
jgi:hypothetical protein